MGAYATPRRGLVLLLSLLLVMPIAAATAEEPEPQLLLSIENLQIPDRGYFIAGDIISFDVVLSNVGEQAAITSENPVCPASFTLHQDETIGFDSWLENGCRNQSRGIELAAGEDRILDSFQYRLEDMEFGQFTIEANAPSTEYTTSEGFLFQSVISIESNITLEVIIADTPSGDQINDPVEPVEALVRMVNHEAVPVEIDIDEDCRLAASISGERTFLTELSCDAGLDEIPANALVDVGWISIENLSADTHELLITLPSQDDLVATSSFTWQEGEEIDDQGLSASIKLDREKEYGSGDQVVFSVSIDNSGDERVNLTFPTTCRAEVHVIDQEGQVVYDTRDIRDCPEVEVSHSINAGESLELNHSPWNFIARDGCELESGEYRLVVDVPSLAIRGYSSLTFIPSGENLDCRQNGNSSLDITSLEQIGEDKLSLAVELTAEDLRWVQPCRLTINLYDSATNEQFRFMESCGAEPGERYRNLNSSALDAIIIEMLGMELEALPSGTYRLDIETNSWPSASASIEFEWPMIVPEVDNQSAEDEYVDDTIDTVIVHGSWSYLTTDIGGCWLFTDDMGRESVLNDASALGTVWSPSEYLAGNYSINLIGEAHHTCSQYPSFDIHALQDEYTMAQPDEPDINIVEEAPQGIITEYGGAIVTGAVAVSFTALLVAFITTNEGIRLPLTGISLGLLGLIGRTHETNDGRFQRGRLMGYLTANPGCHFRALLAALEMSNGQLTHHIKVLEDEERIWRRGDGRLVRFYPSTISMSTPSDELPIPPLSPDPNSLQGKILRLLDDDGQLGEYPTQSDLAIRLEKSQQLISHHLRTLQKFGLVEKRKFGVRNRYKLTREALFLLESSDL